MEMIECHNPMELDSLLKSMNLQGRFIQDLFIVDDYGLSSCSGKDYIMTDDSIVFVFDNGNRLKVDFYDGSSVKVGFNPLTKGVDLKYGDEFVDIPDNYYKSSINCIEVVESNSFPVDYFGFNGNDLSKYQKSFIDSIKIFLANGYVIEIFFCEDWTQIDFYEDYSTSRYKYQEKRTEGNIVYSRDGNYLLRVDDSDCEMLEISDGTKTICKTAFLNCPKLKEIVIPKSLLHFYDGAFMDCNLSQIKTYSDNLVLIDDLLVDKMEKKAVCCLENKKIRQLPKEVEFLDKGLFSGDSEIEELVLHNTLRSIGQEAFVGCKKLEKVSFSYLLYYIGKRAFANCKNLKNIDFPLHYCLAIDDEAFRGSGIETLTFYDLPTYLGHNIFKDCKPLPQIIIPNGWYNKFVDNLGDEYVGLLKEEDILSPENKEFISNLW